MPSGGNACNENITFARLLYHFSFFSSSVSTMPCLFKVFINTPLKFIWLLLIKSLMLKSVTVLYSIKFSNMVKSCFKNYWHIDAVSETCYHLLNYISGFSAFSLS